jgi:DUF4097 and DUF4098 domain-containing protein YvlB
MRSKLMTTLFVTVLGLTTAPLALEQFNNLKSSAERWTRNTFLSGIVTVHASTNETVKSEPPASVASVARNDSSDEFHWNGRIAAGRTIEIKGINGNVNAEPSASDQVEVVAVKKGRRSDPKEVEIRVVEHSNGVTICSVYPSGDANRPNDCQPGESWHSNTRDNDVFVEFTVRVPQGVRFRGYTVNGNVETGALASDAEAWTVNGSIKISSAGIARAMTVNGSIIASLGSANWTSPLEFKTVNGSITLDLPSDTSAELSAETLNGDITSDFQLNTLTRVGRKHLNGTIGDGGRELSLKTINGSIRLHRAS